MDRLRSILHGGKGVIASMEAAEKEKTGIRTLKIGYNKVFGYYIEVSNSFKDQVPDTYIRKQTLVNGERYITQELKDLEHDILSASDRVSALEYELFTRLRQERGLTVHDLQRFFGFDAPQAIYKWQKGQSLPSIDNLYALSALFQVSMNEILVSSSHMISFEQQDFPCCSNHFPAVWRAQEIWQNFPAA